MTLFRWLATLILLYSCSIEAREPQASDSQCENISGDYSAVGTLHGKDNRASDILREAFKYSLPEEIGDPRKYEDVLRTKYDWFRLSIKDNTFLFQLYNGRELARQFSFAVNCTSMGWQSERTTERYLDGNTIHSRFVSTYSTGGSGSLVLNTHVSGTTRGLLLSHQRDDVTVTVQFQRHSG